MSVARRMQPCGADCQSALHVVASSHGLPSPVRDQQSGGSFWNEETDVDFCNFETDVNRELRIPIHQPGRPSNRHLLRQLRRPDPDCEPGVVAGPETGAALALTEDR